jgi:hypothetical protein
MMDIVEKLHDWCESIRRKPEPLAFAIPMVQQAADEIVALRSERDALKKEVNDLRLDNQIMQDEIDWYQQHNV